MPPFPSPRTSHEHRNAWATAGSSKSEKYIGLNEGIGNSVTRQIFLKRVEKNPVVLAQRYTNRML